MESNYLHYFIYVLSVSCRLLFAYDIQTYDLLMPNVWPYRDDAYLCTPIRLTPGRSFNIVGFHPNGSMNYAHHMLIFGCSEPGLNDPVWSCSEMSNNVASEVYKTASPCKSGSQIVYAWARDAKSLSLPQDVGFPVGADTSIKYLVLQVHYSHKFPDGETDNSGVFLEYTTDPMPRKASIFLLGTGGSLPAKRVTNMESACTIEEDKIIHPFAFRAHTHGLGKVVSGYRVRQGEHGEEWLEIGKKDPQLPQMFYPVTHNMTIRRGDVVAARCTMNNTRDWIVSVGQTSEDEMCNFYMMYWVENDDPLTQKYCFTAGPPYWSWERAEQNFASIPDVPASTL